MVHEVLYILVCKELVTTSHNNCILMLLDMLSFHYFEPLIEVKVST